MTDSPTSQLHVTFRAVRPTDMEQCYALERESYPDDEAASKTTLQFRQHHAARYFRCAVLLPNDESNDEDQGEAADSLVANTSSHAAAPSNNQAESDDDTVIGFVCSTLCREFNVESMNTHVPSGPLLAIHSVVVAPQYRRQGIATKMLLDYIQFIQDSNLERSTPIEKFVLLAKPDMLTFYLNCGFSVLGKSVIAHGSESWYHLERALPKPPQDKGLACYVVNAFCESQSAGSSGNPAAVVVLPDGTDLQSDEQQAWMQMVAAQFNLSETAFVLRQPRHDLNDDESAQYWIRYFTPTTQVALCGHATLASAAVLYQTQLNTTQTPIRFSALENELVADYASPSSDRQTRIKMKFPLMPVLEIEDEDARHEIGKMLEVALDMVDSDCLLFIGFTDLGDILVEVTYESFIQIGSIGDIDYNGFNIYDGYTRGVIVCCEAPPRIDEEDGDGMDAVVTVDFYSRFFAPKAGIPEDPVTGSAHATLAPYFGKKLFKTRMKGMQMSKRGGVVECQLLMDESVVELTGLAVTVLKGELFM